MYIPGQFPATRLRRNRKSAWIRNMTAEARLHPHDLIWPLFVQEGQDTRTPIATLPGVNRLSIGLLIGEAREAAALGIPAIALFPVVEADIKTDDAAEAFNPDNLACRAIRALKKHVPEIGVICDVALDPYTSHGHDGLIVGEGVHNDRTLEALARQAITLADAGCDIIAPSDMMDGRIGYIRTALDAAGHDQIAILSYAAKYASRFYGPFRDAVGSAGNLKGASKATYQMQPSNSDEALREVALDLEEGADMVMVKPGMPFLDVLHRISAAYPVPVLAYQVSGEYAMLRAAAAAGAFDYHAAMLESLLCFKRAGAASILTYAAKEIAEILQKNSQL